MRSCTRRSVDVVPRWFLPADDQACRRRGDGQLDARPRRWSPTSTRPRNSRCRRIRRLGVAGFESNLPTNDATRPLGVVSGGEPGRALFSSEALTASRSRSLAILALEGVGVGTRALELAVEYVKDRVQFGRPIGSYQAVSHPLATAYTELELARSLAWWAAWCVSEDDPQAAVAAAAAGAEAADAAVATCERAIQAHGGIGFTWEHVLHRLYKRALGIRSWEASSRSSGPRSRATFSIGE